MELNELRKTAEEATHGPWECVEGYEAFGVRASVGSLTWDDHSGELFKKEDAEFIATFNPETVLTLLSRLEQAEQQVERVRGAASELANHTLPDAPRGSAWLLAEGAQLFAKDILETLDGDTRRCLECNGTGDVQVQFNHGIQTQDCAVCFGTGDGRG